MAVNHTPQALALALVDSLKKRLDISDSLEAAFRAVPRHLFLPDVPLEKAYADEAVPVKRDRHGMVVSSSSQPSMMALMLKQLKLRPGDNVLEIGAGTGYNAAIMQHIVGNTGTITSIEVDPLLANQARDNLQRAGVEASSVHIVAADGAMGYAPRASYDRIIATAAIWDVPVAWRKQLKDAGILVTPIWLTGLQVSAAFSYLPDNTLYSENNIPCGFVQLQGSAAGPSFSKRADSSSLVLTSEKIDLLDSAALGSLLSSDNEPCFLGLSLSSSDYWYGFLPYLMLHEPEDYLFVMYGVEDAQKAYGVLENSGFALVTHGSACFAPYIGEGHAHCFGGADAFITLHDCMAAWDSAGRPGIDRICLRLIPVELGEPQIEQGRLFKRRDHYLHIWQDETE